MTDFDPFSSEERMKSGNSVLSVLDALDDEDVKATLLELREAARDYRDALIAVGVTKHDAMLSTIGCVIGDCLPENEA